MRNTQKGQRQKICGQEVIHDFLMGGLIIILSTGFLVFIVMKLANRTILLKGDIALLSVSVAIVFALIFTYGISLCRTSISYLRWYQAILDTIPFPIVVTDKKAIWKIANKAAEKVMMLKPDSNIEQLNSLHLIDENGHVLKRFWMNEGRKYRTGGSRLICDNEEIGYLLLFYDVYEILDSFESRTELINEINRLLKHMSTATDQFHDCASSLSKYAVSQADTITLLSDVIAGIASGELNEARTLNDRMNSIVNELRANLERGKVHMTTMKETVKELDVTRTTLDDVFRNIDDS